MQGKLTVQFHGEEGIDAGGVSREWYMVWSPSLNCPSKEPASKLKVHLSSVNHPRPFGSCCCLLQHIVMLEREVVLML